MATLYVMVGIPGSGKSTFAKAHTLPDEIYVSRDEIRFNLLNNDEDYFSHENEVTAEFYHRISEGLKSGHNVWADATHISAASRRKLMNALEVKPDECIAVIMRTPYVECRKRNLLRQGRAFVPINVLSRMKNNYEDPHGESFFSSYIEV